MTTAYLLTDTLPKDAGGAKILAPVNDQNTSLDFGILRGINAESHGAASLNLLHLAVGSHTAGSDLRAGHAGMTLLGAYVESASSIAAGNTQTVRVDREGAVYVRPASNVVTFSSASVETYNNGSQIVIHDIIATVQDVNTGSIIFEDNGAYKFGFVVTSTSQNFSAHFATGWHFDSLTHTLADLGGGGGASVTVAWSPAGSITI
jgi:hypothetical protein